MPDGNAAAKKPYLKPTLKLLGTAAEVTLNFVSTNMNDSRFGNSTKT